MTVHLRPLSGPPLVDFLVGSADGYVASQVATGETEQVARRNADRALLSAFPGNRPAGGHALFEVVDEAGTAVGHLWVGPDGASDSSTWSVWDLAIEPDRRGQGHGRAAMLLAEEYVRARGGRRLTLHVFGTNTVARALYESLGFEVTQSRMAKRL